MATGSCWRPASPPGLTGAPGSALSKLGAWAEPSRSRGDNSTRACRSLAPSTGKDSPNLSQSHEELAFPKPSPRPSALQDGRRRSGAGERKGPSLGRKRNEGPGAGGISSCSSPSNGSGKCDLLCIPGAVPWGDLSQQPWAGGADKEARQAERGPRGEAGGVRGAGAVPGKWVDSGSRGGGAAWPMERRGPGRRALLPAFKRETARCPALGAPSADRATQCEARALLSVRLTPRRAPQAPAAAAHHATRRERRSRRPAALTGERRGAGQRVCVCVCECVRACACARSRRGLQNDSSIPLLADARQHSVSAGRGPAVPWGESRRTIAGSFLPRSGLPRYHLERSAGKDWERGCQEREL